LVASFYDNGTGHTHGNGRVYDISSDINVSEIINIAQFTVILLLLASYAFNRYAERLLTMMTQCQQCRHLVAEWRNKAHFPVLVYDGFCQRC